MQLSGAQIGGELQSLCIARFPGESVPVVLLQLYTGGAHCCFVVRAWPATPGATPTDENNGNAGTEVTKSLAGAEIVTADNSFYYAFAPFAASGAPVVVQSFGNGRFVDVTGQHPDLLQADANQWMSIFYQSESQGGSGLGGLGALAAWAGDECRLGITGEPWAILSQLQSQNMLNSPSGYPTGQAFIDQLHRFLTQHGYCTS